LATLAPKVGERLGLIWEIASHLKRPFNTVAIIGKPASGKSSLGFLIANFLSRYIFYTTEPEALEEESLVRLKPDFGLLGSKRVVMLLDDFTYAITGRSNADRRRLKNLMEIRHILGENKRYYVILVGHYMRALAPVLRSAHIKILTSLDASEVRLYSQEFMFSENSLLTYFEYLQERPNQYLVLVNFGTTEKIMNLTLGNAINEFLTKRLLKKNGVWKLYIMKYGRTKLLNYLKNISSSDNIMLGGEISGNSI